MIALVRSVSPTLERGERTFTDRLPIDVALATSQHQTYVRCLSELGAEVRTLPADPAFPDSVFVEDTALVLDEIAVIARPGAESRRGEVIPVVHALAELRDLAFIRTPGTLEGGDVLACGKTLFVGLSSRTDAEGIDQLQRSVTPFGYRVQVVPVHGTLHLLGACSRVAEDVLLVNRAWVDAERLTGCVILDVPPREPSAANTLRIGEEVVVAHGFPETEDLLGERGIPVRSVDVSEFQKAEGGVSCLSLLLSS